MLSPRLYQRVSLSVIWPNSLSTEAHRGTEDSSIMSKRLLKEASAARKPHPHLVSLEPINENLFIWRAVLLGPPETPFHRGQWRIRIKIPATYPLHPPVMFFEDPICHPNVDFKTGEICLDVLKAQWTPAWTLVSSLMAVQSLLANPEPDSPLNIDAANLVRSGDWKAYQKLVNYYRVQYSIPIHDPTTIS